MDRCGNVGRGCGVRYSLIGRGDRLSSSQPAGAGTGMIRDGFNKNWELGAGVAPNRTPLSTNTGLWPNPIRFAVENTDAIAAGETFGVTLYQQSGASAAGEMELRIFLDQDFNPYNGNEVEVHQQMLPHTGTNAVSLHTLAATVNAAAVPPGSYAVCARLTDGSRSRYLYAQETLVVAPSLQVPSLDAHTLTLRGGVLRFQVHAFPGQQVTVSASSNLIDWAPIETYTFDGNVWEFVDQDAGSFGKRFYRAALAR